MYDTVINLSRIIKQYEFEEYLKYLILNNKSNTAPYHNLYHSFVVFNSSYKIAKSENLSDDRIRVLLLASMFHDMNHSQGKVSDKYNVLNSIDMFLKVSKETQETNNSVLEILKATEYPYVISEDDLTLEQKIIRDADMSQICTDNYFQQNVLGLSEELGLSLLDFVPMQKKFLENISFYTDYGNYYFLPEVQNKLKEIEFFIEILKEVI